MKGVFGVEQPFSNLKSRIAVRVSGSAESTGEAKQLVLSGPDRTTTAAQAQFSIEVDGQDVTSDGATLVLNRDEAELADAGLRGCSSASGPPS